MRKKHGSILWQELSSLRQVAQTAVCLSAATALLARAWLSTSDRRLAATIALGTLPLALIALVRAGGVVVTVLVRQKGTDREVDPAPLGRERARFLRNIWGSREWEEEEWDRVVTTILFTDIVGSTASAAEIGDRCWRELLEKHDLLVRRQLARFHGRELNTTGDGFLATFDRPARAIRCACAIADGVNELGLDVRVGLHTGECEVARGRVSGIAVNIGARVAAEASPGEVLVSNTLKDLVVGSGLRFRERGTSVLRGIPGEWRLFAVERGDGGCQVAPATILKPVGFDARPKLAPLVRRHRQDASAEPGYAPTSAILSLEHARRPPMEPPRVAFPDLGAS